MFSLAFLCSPRRRRGNLAWNFLPFVRQPVCCAVTLHSSNTKASSYGVFFMTSSDVGFSFPLSHKPSVLTPLIFSCKDKETLLLLSFQNLKAESRASLLPHDLARGFNGPIHFWREMAVVESCRPARHLVAAHL